MFSSPSMKRNTVEGPLENGIIATVSWLPVLPVRCGPAIACFGHAGRDRLRSHRKRTGASLGKRNRSIQSVLKSHVAVEPYPSLVKGQQVVLNGGPLKGKVGTLVDIRNSVRLVFSVDLPQRAGGNRTQVGCAFVTAIGHGRAFGVNVP